MAQNTSSDQNQSIGDIEAEIAASRERLARNIDEIAFRAQPKQIFRSQKEQFVTALKGKYNGLMGTSQTESHRPYGETAASGDQRDTKAKVSDMKTQAQLKAQELKAQAQAKAQGLKAQAQEKMPARSTSSTDETTQVQPFAATEPRQGGDFKAQARVKADQARLKLDELTHTDDGELRTERVAMGLAAAGALLVTIGAARRAGS